MTSGGEAENTTWRYRNGVISPTSSVEVFVNASDVLAKMALGDLSIQASAITVAGAVTYSADAAALTLETPGSITVNAAVEVSGPLSLYGINVVVNESLEVTDAGADILLKASNNVYVNPGYQITTNGGDVTLWSDSDASGAGGIRIGSDTAGVFTTGIYSNGGDIVLGGGTDPLTEYAYYDVGLGAAFSAYYYAVGIFGATLDAIDM